MLSAQDNERLTQIGPGTPAGAVLRQYWLPAALTEELEGERPIVPVTLLGEKLMLFKNEDGALALIQRHCPHRGVDLCYGRLEDGGVRCPFHGWHFDASGQCTEQPGEPDGSRMHENIQLKSYPVMKKNGIIFAYLGAGEPPQIPPFDCFAAPQSHVFAFKGLWNCNWLQATEIGIDPAHASFLHRFLQDEDPAEGYGKQFRDRAAKTNMPMTQLLRDYPRPEIIIEDQPYGMRLLALRHMEDKRTHIRITNQIFPCAITIPLSNEMTITQWHVPIDDENCYWYSMFTSFTDPVDKDLMRAQRMKEHRLPDYAPLKGAHNNYGYNADEQASETYTGMGMDINVHDQWAVESMGTVQDRTDEHLGRTDVAIIRFRKMLRAAITAMEEGQKSDLLMQSEEGCKDVFGPISVDAIGHTPHWRDVWQASDADRREKCPWMQ